MELYLFALLPLGLFSIFRDRRDSWRGVYAGFFQLLAPLLASAATSYIGHKKQQSAEKKQAAYEAQQAQQAEAQRKSQFEAEANSPGAAMQRMGFNMRLGRLLGAMGGRGKVPPSLLKAYDSARAMPTYQAGPSYTPKPSSSAGIWDFAGGLANSLSYLDTSKLKGNPKMPTGTTPPIAGGRGFTAPPPVSLDPRRIFGG